MIRSPGFFAVVAVLVALTAFMGSLTLYGALSLDLGKEPPVVVEVRHGETLHDVTGRLTDQGLLRWPWWFKALAILRGDSANIKAGEYVLDRGITPSELLDAFVSGRARFVAVTVPEGYALAEIAARVERRGLGKAERFLALAHDPEFIASLQLPLPQTPSSLEGLLYPETYFFHRGVSEARLIAAMVAQFKSDIAPLLQRGAARVGLTPYEVLTLASIVEKETAVGSERPIIAAVFHNRLNVGMPLASDPTVIYGVPNFDGNLKRVHLRTETPYNTYKVRGLPPTPIASPGKASIEAVMAPARVDYLFFVSRGDGTHEFSKDYRAHRKAVWKYQIRPHRKRNS